MITRYEFPIVILTAYRKKLPKAKIISSSNTGFLYYYLLIGIFQDVILIYNNIKVVMRK